MNNESDDIKQLMNELHLMYSDMYSPIVYDLSSCREMIEATSMIDDYDPADDNITITINKKSFTVPLISIDILAIVDDALKLIVDFSKSQI